jgi:hypothetical protein
MVNLPQPFDGKESECDQIAGEAQSEIKTGMEKTRS